MSIKILADSTCDLSEELIRRFDIGIIPLTVTLGERSGLDGTGITPEDIYRYVEESGNLPKTSAVSVGDFTRVFQTWREQTDEVICFCISSLFSSSYQNACIAAEEIGGVYPFDTYNLSTGEGLIILRAAEMARDGSSVDEILAECRSLVPRVDASFALNQLDYLYKGGRCSALAAFGANLFHIKPAILVKDGHMEPGKKYRGHIDSVIRSYVKDRLAGCSGNIDTHRIFVTHTRCSPETVESVKQLVREFCPDVEEIDETVAGATITTHCGPETLGVLFIHREL
jgi:DegV family protein with EDD domain